MTSHNMDYNTTKTKLLFPEYGRMVQQMVDHAKTIVDDKERQATAQSIVHLMFQMNQQARSQEDMRVKIWKNLFAMSNFEINVQAPAGIDVSPEAAFIKPGKIVYPPITRRMRHYGYNVGALIQKCVEMPDGPKKEAFTETIAAYMKLAYKTWNREHYVSDQVVKDDLETLSDGKLVLENHGSLDILANQAGSDPRTPKSKIGTRGGRGSRGGGSGSGSRGGRGGERTSTRSGERSSGERNERGGRGRGRKG
jgi:hypothetical protein